MARLHFVKKARKDNKVCKKGESYYWWAFMSGGRGGPKHYSKERPKPSQLTQSEFFGTLGDIEDEIGALSADDGLESSCEDIAGRIRELGEEQTSKFDNMPEGLQQGDIGQLLEQRASRCEEIATEFESVDFTDKPDEKDDEPEKEGKDGDADKAKDAEDAEGDESDNYWQEKLDEIQGIDLTCD